MDYLRVNRDRRRGAVLSLLPISYLSSEAQGIGTTPQGTGFLRINLSRCLI